MLVPILIPVIIIVEDIPSEFLTPEYDESQLIVVLCKIADCVMQKPLGILLSNVTLDPLEAINDQQELFCSVFFKPMITVQIKSSRQPLNQIDVAAFDVTIIGPKPFRD
jgi:hypothetical protein